MSDEKIVGLDIGTSVIRVAIGEVDPDTGTIQIIGTASRKSAGISNGVIVNIEDAKTAIQDAIDAAEQNAGTTVESVITAIGGSQIGSLNSRGATPVGVSGKQGRGEISKDDVERVIECATAIKFPDDKEKLHVIPQNFIVDGIGGITDPIHRVGTRLEAEVHIITVSKTIIYSIRSCIARANYELRGVVLKTLAQTQSVCFDDELELGSIIIDMGAGTTDVLVLVKGAPVSTASVPVGGNLVTQDIHNVAGVPMAIAEELKINSGCCWGGLINSENDEEVILPGVGGRPPEIIMKSQLCSIIQARIEQIFKKVRTAIIKNTTDSVKQLSGNIILTGGGAMMEGVIELAQNVFKTANVRLGVPENLGGVTEDYRRPDFATVIGLVVAKKSFTQIKDAKKKTKAGRVKSENNSENIFKKIFKSLF